MFWIIYSQIKDYLKANLKQKKEKESERLQRLSCCKWKIDKVTLLHDKFHYSSRADGTKISNICRNGNMYVLRYGNVSSGVAGKYPRS